MAQLRAFPAALDLHPVQAQFAEQVIQQLAAARDDALALIRRSIQ